LSSAADALPDTVSRIRDLTASTGDLTVAVTGPGAAKVDSTNQFAGVDMTLLLAAAAVVALLLLIYRSPIPWLLPLVAGALAVVVAMSRPTRLPAGPGSQSPPCHRASCMFSCSEPGPTTRYCWSRATENNCASTTITATPWRRRCLVWAGWGRRAGGTRRPVTLASRSWLG